MAYLLIQLINEPYLLDLSIREKPENMIRYIIDYQVI